MLASCATHSRLPPAAEQPNPLAPDPRVCAPVRDAPPLPAGASVVQPVTPEEQAATAKFLNWVAELVDVAGENGGRAKLARQAAC